MNKIVKFTVTHNKGNNRFVPGNKNPDNPDVLFLGCSFTYGHGVNDADNFPAMVQVEHPELSIKNGGVIGYGTVQSLLQLKEEVKKGNLKVVLLNFSAYHFKRNSMSQSYRSDLRIGYKRSSKSADGLMAKSRFPFKRTPKSKIEYVSWESMYSNWPGRSWLASVNGIQSTWDKSIDNGIDEVGVAESLINEIAQICEKNNIKFGMVCLNSTDQTKKLKKRLNSIPWLNINFNFHSDKYTNPTGDIHPNRKGHALIAKRIEPFLKTLLNAE